MQVTEIHRIKRPSEDWKVLDRYLFLSKNLFNIATYTVRQYYINNKTYLNYHELQKQFQNTNQVDYRALPAKISQQILMQVDEAFRSYFKALSSYKKNPKKFTNTPKLPKYKNKISGRNMLIFTNQAISRKDLSLSGMPFKLPTKLLWRQIKQVRVIPGCTRHTIEIIYDKPDKSPILNGIVAALDPGVTNLGTVTFSEKKTPIIIPGGPLKSINQFYNKKRAEYQSKLKDKKTSNRIKKLTTKRNDKINDYMHKASRYLVNHLVSSNVNKLIIGHNKQWKQETNIGKANNQNFVNIPHNKFFQMLQYKCELEGIQVINHEESYTSKCSFLDMESIMKHDNYLGSRVNRGLFISFSGKQINADVNGSYNIMRKAIPNIFNQGIEAVLVQPVRVKPNKNKLWNKIL